MTSQIDPTKPTDGNAYTADVRNNFQTAANEISALQTEVATLKARQIAAAGITTVNPPNTSSAVYVMAGLAVAFTPQNSKRAVIILDGRLGNTTNNDGSNLQLYYGVGTPPAFGALVTATNGQAIGSAVSMLATKNGDFDPFAVSALLGALTVGTTYWLDVAFFAQGGAATLSTMSITAFELLDVLP